MKCHYCHNVITSDVQKPVAVELPEGDVFVHEFPCGQLIKREMEKNELLSVLAKLSDA